MTTKELKKPPMKILLLGKNGQLGWELHRTLQPLGAVHSLDYPEIDLAQPESVRAVILDIRPQIIVNATAYTAVDEAETHRDLAMAINAHAPGIMAQAAAELGSIFIHYSTDYVFDGKKGSPYVETDSPNPLNVYGYSKLAGEQAISQVGGAYLILRTSWVYSLRRDSFVTKVLQWAREKETLRIVDDQISCPTSARMLAETTALLLARGGQNPMEYISERAGIYHLAGGGACSRYEWAKAILKYDPNPQEQIVQQVLPARTKDFPAPAKRPLYSALDCEKFEKTFPIKIPAWEETLTLALS